MDSIGLPTRFVNQPNIPEAHLIQAIIQISRLNSRSPEVTGCKFNKSNYRCIILQKTLHTIENQHLGSLYIHLETIDLYPIECII